MATTYRKTTSAFQSGEENLLASPAVSRKYRSATTLARQDVRFVEQLCPLEIVVPLFAAMAKTAAALHAQSNGSTVSVTEGNLLGRSRFAVSIYPENSAELTGAPTQDLLFAFAVLNGDLLLLRDHALGTWFDCQRNRHVVDVVVCLSSLHKAISLGIDHGQQAIFDLKKARETSLVSTLGARSVEIRCAEN